MAAGKGGKHNKEHSSLEFNVLSPKTEYRYQRPGLLEGRGGSCPHNLENKNTGQTQQVIYSVVFFAFSLNPEDPVGTVNATRREHKRRAVQSRSAGARGRR